MVFDKIKQMKQIMDLQKQMKEEKAEVEKDGIKVVVNGKMEIEYIGLNHEKSAESQEKLAKDCINEAMKKAQMNMAMKMQNFPGFGL